VVQRWIIGWEFFCSPQRLERALGPTHPIKWVPGALSLTVKRPGREADHSHPSNAEVKNAWSYTSSPPIRLHGGSSLRTCGVQSGQSMALRRFLTQWVAVT
jgi:hypothetical protein